MRISTVGYSMKQGVKNIGRNKLFSIASIATMAACIFLFGLFYSIVVNFNYIVEKAEEGVAITVFFEEDATDKQKEEIGEELKNADGVLEVELCQRRGCMGISSRKSILAITQNWRKVSRQTIRWQTLITMKYIWQTYPSSQTL